MHHPTDKITHTTALVTLAGTRNSSMVDSTTGVSKAVVCVILSGGVKGSLMTLKFSLWLGADLGGG